MANTDPDPDPDAIRRLYSRWLEQVWGGQPGAAHRLVSEDFVGHWPRRQVHGPVELEEIVAQTLGMFDELTLACRSARSWRATCSPPAGLAPERRSKVRRTSWATTCCGSTRAGSSSTGLPPRRTPDVLLGGTLTLVATADSWAGRADGVVGDPLRNGRRAGRR